LSVHLMLKKNIIFKSPQCCTANIADFYQL
jgi:hypothetical protein